MTDRHVVFLPADATGTLRWLRVANGGVAARGDGVPVLGEHDRVVAVAPAVDVALHWAILPDRSEAQALAAARIMAAEVSLTPIDKLHIAIGDAQHVARADGQRAARPVATVSAELMRGWMALLAEQGIDPEAVIPAPMLLAAPEYGFVRADLGGEVVVRGAEAGFADEPGLTDALTGGEAPLTLERDAIEAAVAGTVAAPSLDLRQGAFGHRKRPMVDWGQMRRVAWLLVAVLAVSLTIGIVRLVREEWGASLLEAQADTLARQGLRPGETINDASRQLDERLHELRGPGLGFTRTAGAVFAAVRAVPDSEVTAMIFDGKGGLRVSVVTQGEGAANDLRRQIIGMGFDVQQVGNFTASGGRISGDLMVTPR